MLTGRPFTAWLFEIWPDTNPRHHATVLMFENMAMIDEIASYREWNVDRRGVGFTDTVAPVGDAIASAIGMLQRYAAHEDAFGEDFVWHICFIEFSRR
jgi:hypothetical protein